MKLAAGLKSILDGDFVIEWHGKVMGFWIDMQGDDIICHTTNASSLLKYYQYPRILSKSLF